MKNNTANSSQGFSSNYEKIAMHVSKVGLIGNFFLSLFKLLAGIFAHSQAMISDAVHSASDVISTIIVIIGIKISCKESDHDHPYGHERMESMASLLLAILLGAIGVGIGYKGVMCIYTGEYKTAAAPGMLALAAAIISIVTKEWMYRYTSRAAKKINSSALMADAWHHRSDALSSIGSLVGISGAIMGFPIMDSLASIVICVFIVKAALDIFRDASGKMVDHACSDEFISQVTKTVLDTENVIGIDSLKTRQFGARAYVDVEITVNRDLKLSQAHEIAEAVHHSIEAQYPEVKHCMVHVNPAVN